MSRRKSGIKREIQGDNLTLSTGVVLKVQTVPAWKFSEMGDKLERPVIPEMDVDGRKVANPSDPDYLKAVKVFDEKMAEQFNNLTIVFGTEIVSIPDGFPKPDDEAWKEKVEWSGTQIGTGPVNAYLAWVKYVAAPRMDDIRSILSEVGRRSSVPEADVKTSADNFRR